MPKKAPSSREFYNNELSVEVYHLFHIHYLQADIHKVKLDDIWPDLALHQLEEPIIWLLIPTKPL